MLFLSRVLRSRVVRTGCTACILLLTHPGNGSVGQASTRSGLAAVCAETKRPWLGEFPAAETAAEYSAGAVIARDVRVVTYNIHSGLGPGFALAQARSRVERNLRDIAAAIAAAAPSGQPVEVVALNEVDFGSRRSAWIDESAFVAEELRALTGHRYEVVRGQTWERRSFGREVRFGNALLTRLPVVAAGVCLLGDHPCEGVRAAGEVPGVLPSRLAGWWYEERGVIKATLRADHGLVDVIVTHLDAFSSTAREAQAMHLLHRFVDPSHTTLLLGDLNAVSTVLTGKRRFFGSDRTLDILTSGSLGDVRMTYASIHGLGSIDRWATHPSTAPEWPLDAVLATADLVPQQIEVIGGTASDHRGLMARLAPAAGAHELAIELARHERIRAQQRDRILQCDLTSKDSRRTRGWLLERTGFAPPVS